MESDCIIIKEEVEEMESDCIIIKEEEIEVIEVEEERTVNSSNKGCLICRSSLDKEDPLLLIEGDVVDRFDLYRKLTESLDLNFQLQLPKAQLIEEEFQFCCQICFNDIRELWDLQQGLQNIRQQMAKLVNKLQFSIQINPVTITNKQKDPPITKVHGKLSTSATSNSTCDTRLQLQQRLIINDTILKENENPDPKGTGANVELTLDAEPGINTQDVTRNHRCESDVGQPILLEAHKKSKVEVIKPSGAADENKTMKCTYCRSYFKGQTNLNRHIQQAHYNKLYGQKGGLSHKKKGADDIPITCHCGKVLKGPLSLSNHIKRLHSKGLQCPHCTKEFGVQSVLMKHIHKFHKIDKAINSDTRLQQQQQQSIIKDKTVEKTVNTDMEDVAANVEVIMEDHNYTFEGATINQNMQDATIFNVFLIRRIDPGSEAAVQNQNHVLSNAQESEVEISDAIPPNLVNPLRSAANEFKCTECVKCFKSKYTLNKHMQRVHSDGSSGDNQFKCQVAGCSKIFVCPISLTSHITKIHKDSNVLQCPQCTKEFRVESLLKKHVDRFHAKKGPVTCEICGGTYRDKTLLRHHRQRVHEKLRPVACTEDGCSYRFCNKTELREHITVHHNPFRTAIYTCEICGKSYKSFSGLYHHKKNIHEEAVKKYICQHPGCGYAFHTQSIFKRHMITHTGIRPFRCLKCGKSFAHTSTLYKHKLRLCYLDPQKRQEFLEKSKASNQKCRRNGKRCPVCKTKFFLRESSREWHMKKCHPTYSETAESATDEGVDEQGKVKYNCDICGFSSLNKMGLTNHKRWIHRIKRVLACSKCNETFTVQLKLKEHMMKIHNNSKKPETANKLHKPIPKMPGRKLSKRILCHKCEKCNLTFTAFSDKALHFKELHGGWKPHACPEKNCSHRFRTNRNLILHIRKHEVNKRPCKVCGNIFKRLNRHEKKCMKLAEENGGQLPIPKYKQNEYSGYLYQCPKCDEVLSKKNYMELHLKKVHGDISPDVPKGIKVTPLKVTTTTTIRQSHRIKKPKKRY